MVNDRDKLHLMVVAFPDGEPCPAPIPLTGNAIRVGRGTDNDLVLPKTAATIAQQHAVFRQIDGSWCVVDQSVNGTYHNDRLLHHEASGPLSLGDRIRLGETVLAVQLVNPPWKELVLSLLPDAPDSASTEVPIPPPLPPAPPVARYATLLDAFLARAGLPQPRPDLDPVAAMRALGESSRAIVRMLVDLARRRPPSVARLERRHPPPYRYNPLKFSIDEEEAMLALLGRRRAGCLTGTGAVQEVGDDLSGEAAITDKCHTAIGELFRQLAPNLIEDPHQPLYRLLQRDTFRRRYVTAYVGLRQRYTESMRQLAAEGRMAEEENPQQNA